MIIDITKIKTTKRIIQDADDADVLEDEVNSWYDFKLTAVAIVVIVGITNKIKVVKSFEEGWKVRKGLVDGTDGLIK
jgi:hypothetical protein